jgi:hypothetical protein
MRLVRHHSHSLRSTCGVDGQTSPGLVRREESTIYLSTTIGRLTGCDDQYCPSPLSVHSSSMQHQVISCASIAATNNR